MNKHALFAIPALILAFFQPAELKANGNGSISSAALYNTCQSLGLTPVESNDYVCLPADLTPPCTDVTGINEWGSLQASSDDPNVVVGTFQFKVRNNAQGQCNLRVSLREPVRDHDLYYNKPKSPFQSSTSPFTTFGEPYSVEFSHTNYLPARPDIVCPGGSCAPADYVIPTDDGYESFITLSDGETRTITYRQKFIVQDWITYLIASAESPFIGGARGCMIAGFEGAAVGRIRSAAPRPPSFYAAYAHESYSADNFSTSCLRIPGGANIPPSGVAVDLSVAISQTSATVPKNSNHVYTLSVENTGPSVAQNAQLTFNVPPEMAISTIESASTGFTCTHASNVVSCAAPSYGIRTSQIKVHTTSSNTLGQTHGDASITNTVLDLNTANNASSITTTIVGSPALSFTKEAPAAVLVGQTFDYTITGRNSGDANATSVEMQDVLNNNLTYVSATGTGWTCNYSAANRRVRCTRGSIAAGATAPAITIRVTASNTPASVVNTCSYFSAQTVSTDAGCRVVTIIQDQSADLSFSKSGPANVTAGGAISWTINGNNAGPSVATNVVMTDTVPTGVTGISANGAGWSCTVTGQTVRCTRASLAVGAAPAITVNATAPTTAGSITNTCTATSDVADPTPGHNCSTTTVVGASADLSFSKSGPANVTAGGAISWTITGNNAGPSVATNVVMTDTVPTGVTGITASGAGWSCTVTGQQVRCTRASLAVGAAPAITINATAPTTTGNITNTCTATSDVADPTPGHNCSTTTVVGASADLSFSKSGPANVTAGGAISWTITGNNAGPSVATNVVMTDTVPTGVTGISASGPGWSCTVTGQTVRCTRASLAVGAAPAITVNATAPTTTGNITNTCTASSDTSDPTPGHNCTATTNVTPSADLSFSKSGPASVTAGATISWTITGNNAGPSVASGVVMTDNLPTGVTDVMAVGTGWSCAVTGQQVRCTRASLAVGAAPAITITGKAPSEAGSITNTCTATSTTPDPTPGHNCTATTVVGASADLSFSKSGPTTVTAGSAISWAVTGQNFGPSVSQNVVMTDTVPEGVTGISASGAGWSCTVTGQTVRCTRASLAVGAAPAITINATAPTTAGSITNICDATSDTFDPTPRMNCQATTVITAQSDLSFSKSGPATATAGGAISWTITGNNAGPSVATNVVMTDTVPTGVTGISASGAGWSCTVTGQTVRCTRASLAVGAAPAITINGTAPSTAGSITNICSASSDANDPTPTHPNCTTTTEITPIADLEYSKTGPTTVRAGEEIIWSIEGVNNGPSVATNIVINDTVPSGVTGVTVLSASGVSCTVNGQVVRCTSASVAAGSTFNVTLRGTAPSAAGTVVNTCTISTDTPDSNTSNQSCSASTQVTALSNLSFAKTGPATVSAGSPISWTITGNNAGPSVATNVVMTDTVPTGVTGITANGAGWSCTVTGQTVRCTRSSLAVGAAPAITVNGTAPSTAGSIVNTCVAATDTPGSINNQACNTSTTVSGLSGVSIAKSDSADPVNGNEAFSYFLDVRNGGPSVANNLVVTDTLPTQVTGISVNGDGWTCSLSSGVVTCNRASLAVNTTSRITVNVRANNVESDIQVTNTARVQTSTADSDPSDNEASEQTSIRALRADLEFRKDAPATIYAGETLTWTITGRNNGPSNATNVVFEDVIPLGVDRATVSVNAPGWTCGSQVSQMVRCTLASLATGNAPGITISAKVLPAASDTFNILNTCVVQSDVTDPTPGDDLCQATTAVIPQADLSFVKTGTATAIGGERINWEIRASNAGPNIARNVVFTDTVPAAISEIQIATPAGWNCSLAGQVVTCTTPSLGVNAAANIGISGKITGVATRIENICSGQSDTHDPTPLDPLCQTTTVITPGADLNFAKSGPASVTAGGQIEWRIIGTNAGPSPAQSVVMTDTLPSGLTNVTASGSGWTCTTSGSSSVRCTRPAMPVGPAPEIVIRANAPSTAGQITNVCSGESATPDPVLVQQTPCSTTTTVTGSSGLSIAKSDSVDPVQSGATFNYYLDVLNAGPSAASNVVVTDTLPDDVEPIRVIAGDWLCSLTGQNVSCSIATLAANQTRRITVEVKAAEVDKNKTVRNTASVTSSTADANPGDNEAYEDTTILAIAADLGITKNVNLRNVDFGEDVGFTIVATNYGPHPATNVVVEDALPNGYEFIEAITLTSNYDEGDGVWKIGDLDVGETVSLVVWAKVLEVESGANYRNEALIFGDQTDPNLSNNLSSDRVVPNGTEPPDDGEPEPQVEPLYVPVNTPFALLMMALAFFALAAPFLGKRTSR